jgi:hypothetical protein
MDKKNNVSTESGIVCVEEGEIVAFPSYCKMKSSRITELFADLVHSRNYNMIKALINANCLEVESIVELEGECTHLISIEVTYSLEEIPYIQEVRVSID